MRKNRNLGPGERARTKRRVAKSKVTTSPVDGTGRRLPRKTKVLQRPRLSRGDHYLEATIKSYKKSRIKHIVLSMAEVELLLKRPNKQSSPRLLTIASRVLKHLPTGFVDMADVKALADSVLSQDEKRGQ